MTAVEQAGRLMQAEIAEQPAVLERVLTLGEPEVERAAAAIAPSRRPRATDAPRTLRKVARTR